jgi:two-component system, LytTR family, sensor histidine kinase LytS
MNILRMMINTGNPNLRRSSPEIVCLSPKFCPERNLPVIWKMKRLDWTQLFAKPYKVYTQLLFWALVFILYILLKEYPSRMSGVTLICLVLQETLELAIPSYAQNLLVLPLFKRRKWIAGMVVYVILLTALILLLPFLLNAVGKLFGLLFQVSDLVDWRQEHIAFSMVAFTVIASCVKVAVDMIILDKEQKENELRHLKAQLNPHFLFNTLNNLYGLSVAESKKLPDLMLKLSDLLRYSLYDTNQTYVALQKELDYIVNYVELERIRLNGNTGIELQINGSAEDRYIAPLLLIVFIENSFKHLSAAENQQKFVRISIDLKGSFLHMVARNSVDSGSAPDPTSIPGSLSVPKTKRQKTGGLGLSNVRQRLNLIYPRQYHLQIKREAGVFEADLKIDLT